MSGEIFFDETVVDKDLSTEIDLRLFGFSMTVECHGKVEDRWDDGNRLLFLFGERHCDTDEKELNILNAVHLIDQAVAGCVGDEIPFADFANFEQADFERRSGELSREHDSVNSVIAHEKSRAYLTTFFRFGETVKTLRPALEVHCVEDPAHRAEASRVIEAYQLRGISYPSEPFPGFPTFEAHPIQEIRETAFIENMLALWDNTLLDPRRPRAAILNTGSFHCPRIAARLKNLKISYIYISQVRKGIGTQ